MRFLVARPARKPDIDSILAIANEVNIASMANNRRRRARDILQSSATLEGRTRWDQGLLFLVTEIVERANDSGRVIGCCKLMPGAGGYWTIKERETFGGGQVARTRYLTFETLPPHENSFEVGGNYVLQAYRSRRGKGRPQDTQRGNLKVGTFNSNARVLFLLMYKKQIEAHIGPISLLFTNLLTVKVKQESDANSAATEKAVAPGDGGVEADQDGRTRQEADADTRIYPFYEKVVRRLLGNLPYEKADRLRYSDPQGFASLLLGSVARPDPPQLPLHLIPSDIFQALGSVREETKGAEIIWTKYGFKPVNKYDALDGGRYLEIGFPQFERRVQRNELQVRHGRLDDLLKHGRHYTFAPARKMSAFICARALARIDDDTFLVDQAAFNELDLGAGERVWILEPPDDLGAAGEPVGPRR